jgi:hypothetical protein
MKNILNKIKRNSWIILKKSKTQFIYGRITIFNKSTNPLIEMIDEWTKMGKELKEKHKTAIRNF